MLVYGVLSDYEKQTDIVSTTILWIIGKFQFQMLTIPLTETQLDQAINDKKYSLRQLIINQLPGFDAASHDLYNQLLPKVARTEEIEDRPHFMFSLFGVMCLGAKLALRINVICSSLFFTNTPYNYDGGQ